jgi:DEAD/DEAH box helicase domain-containing protein
VKDTASILNEKGYDYYYFKEEGIKPETVKLRFYDIVPELKDLEIGRSYLYKHQYEAYNELLKGKNLILKSGTGSGKTEAWLIYALSKRVKTLVIYPTLALANDQIKRIEAYSEKLNLKCLAIDALKKSEFLKEYDRARLIEILSNQDILVTNPAFLMFEVKNIAKKGKSLLHNAIKYADLIVIDEIDFYSPREIALILGLLDLIKAFNERNFQIATLTAMIENPEDLAKFYTELNKRETAIITGKPFKVENRTYVILGKDLKSIWEKLRKNKDKIIKNAGKDVIEALNDYDKFKNNYFKVIEVARANDIEIRIDFDINEILMEYIDDDYVTLVFTKGINKAEEVAKRLAHSLPKDLQTRVASHHHLILKELRIAIEEGARKGRIKVLVSPRTLSQGIDIGTIARIVHIGLPESLREFYQKEGRKGRREEIPFSESIIIPSGRWDRHLLSRGKEALDSWLGLPIEKIIINVNNQYRILFEAITKFVSPFLRDQLKEEERELLLKLGLVSKGELTERGKEVYRKLNFYEFAPPYGINRIMLDENGNRYYLEEISHADLVEKFQPGCFDYSSEGIVVSHKIGGTRGRIVTAVEEERISFMNLLKREELAPVLEEYEETKFRWYEEPNLYLDFITGKLSSEVLCVVDPPRKGFGKYLKVPNRVYWRIKSFKPKIKVIDSKTIVYFDHKVIEVPTATYGKYSDYTYGATYELDPSEDTTLIRIGLAYLMLVLRRKLQIPFETILYDVGKYGEKKFFSLHELDSAGLIVSLDLLNLKKIVNEYIPDSLDEILFEALDEYSYADFLSYNLNWDLAKRYALKVLDYMLLSEKIIAKFKGKEIAIPKPSRALKIACFESLFLPLNEDKGIVLFGIYDGENVKSFKLHCEFGLIEDVSEVVKYLSQIIDEKFDFILYDFASTEKLLKDLNIKSILYFIKSLKEENKIIEVKEYAKNLLNLEIAPLEEIEKIANIDRKVSIFDISMEIAKASQKISQLKVTNWKNYIKYLDEKLIQYIEENCKSIYLLYLIFKEYKNK